MVKNKLVYVGFSFEHHKNRCAGYDKIRYYLPYDHILDCQWEYELLYQNNNFLIRFFRKAYFKLFGYGFIFTTIFCIILNFFCKNTVFHFVYGENIFIPFNLLKRKSNKIVCTFHQPASFIESRKWLKKIRCCDFIILMTAKDVQRFKEWTGKDNVCFIPHGINTDFYSPLTGIKTISVPDNLLMVGNWQRDFAFARDVFSEILKLRKFFEFNIVTPAMNHFWFGGLKNLNLYKDITDIELRDLYRKSKCVFFPLFNFTANNAYLEALSTGCKIIIASDYKDEDSYLKTDSVVLIRKEIKLAVLEIIRVVESKKNNNCNDLKHAEILTNYSWQNIANITRNKLLRV